MLGERLDDAVGIVAESLHSPCNKLSLYYAESTHPSTPCIIIQAFVGPNMYRIARIDPASTYPESVEALERLIARDKESKDALLRKLSLYQKFKLILSPWRVMGWITDYPEDGFNGRIPKLVAMDSLQE
jgi:hypothetical protein